MLSDDLFDTDPQLLNRVVKGDEAAFRTLFHQYWDHIYTVAFTFTKSDTLSEELVQDIFLKIWIGREKLDGVASFSNYLFIVARNHILNQLRKKVYEVPFREQVLAYFAADDNPEQYVQNRQVGELVERGIALLSPQQQAVYRMSRQQGMNQDEIAAALGISVSTVKTHMSKALYALREFLKSHSGDAVGLIALLSHFL
ncbi:RNA polymerase sigma factor [Filimonas effusa]|uniref:RNA polymerase sigma-70 factor n=1 Tax=Filimonas effusa TaxID=2508721 RepID=A0A4Q1D5I4_9BACT|nr:RNA polymerase sigma-70 factor [Filimonas effusa]RXK83113.1 RNA polymerase sigma-70 factor [Filimonas effusa]